MKNKGFLKAFLSLIFPTISFVALKIIDNLLGNGISLIEYCLVCLVIVFLMTAFFFVIAVAITKIDEILDHKYNETNCSTTEKCKYGEYVCCAKLALETIQGDYDLILDSTIARQYNLFTESEIIKKESDFINGEIWIFSYDLTTEVLGDIASTTVENNWKKGVVYREFYISDKQNDFERAEMNRKKMEKTYQQAQIPKGKKCLEFYPYSDPNSMLSYMFALFGIVLYIKDVDNPDTIEAYFSLRSTNGRVKKPIYVKMPHCMTNKYYSILSNIIKKEVLSKSKDGYDVINNKIKLSDLIQNTK